MAKASPCYVTVCYCHLSLVHKHLFYFLMTNSCYHQYLKDSIDGIVTFFESHTPVSQAIALEAAAAVQVSSL